VAGEGTLLLALQSTAGWSKLDPEALKLQATSNAAQNVSATAMLIPRGLLSSLRFAGSKLELYFEEKLLME